MALRLLPDWLRRTWVEKGDDTGVLEVHIIIECCTQKVMRAAEKLIKYAKEHPPFLLQDFQLLDHQNLFQIDDF